ncbi:MAG TPA: hypothetical protein VNJ04_02555 [Gemmatimonadaceae bacterium]|nr:hypothetical protein [Gemmatimonadaceae bacterium]
MMLYMWGILQIDPLSATSWEVAKGVMLTLTTSGVSWIAWTLFIVSRDVHDLKKCVGINGNTGLEGQGKAHAGRLGKLETWKTEVHAVEAADRMRYEGENKRHTRRRALDQLHEKDEGAEDDE